MSELPDIVHEDAVGIVGVVAQRASGTGLADGAGSGLISRQRREGKGAAGRGIRKLPNLAPLELAAKPERVLSRPHS